MHIIVTGGTLDKKYNHLNGDLHFEESHIEKILKQSNCTLDITYEVLMLKDSLDMVEVDRELVYKACLECKDNKILITHGTDTMVETGLYIQKKDIKNKTIVLTGAMIPYSFGYSDILFNTGTSVATLQAKTNGIYICMNGKIFDIENVYKDKTVGQFKELA